MTMQQVRRRAEPYTLIAASMAIAVLMFFAVPVIGAEAVTKAPVDDGVTLVSWWMQALLATAVPLGGYVLMLVRKLLRMVFAWLAAKTRIEMLAVVGEHANAIVAELWHTMVKEMKAGAADGKLTSAEKKAIKAAAVASVKGQLGKVFLEKAFGTTGAPLHDSVSAAVEGELASFKRMERAAAAANPTGLF